MRWPATATVRFVGTSTLHDFAGELPSQPFVLVISNGAWSAEADVLAGSMATGSEGRDRNMHRMLNTNDHPRLRGKVVSAPVPSAAGTNAMLNLKIQNRQFDLPVRVTDWRESAEEITFHAAWEVSLKQYGLKPPSVLAVIRVGDIVRIETDVRASKTNSPAPATALRQ
jgi:polyisoprenoid-binding protein YceI